MKYSFSNERKSCDTSTGALRRELSGALMETLALDAVRGPEAAHEKR
jgi:hypothetical protein